MSRDFIEGREDHVVNNHSQYCCVVKTGVGSVKMVLGGEVDASMFLPVPGLCFPYIYFFPLPLPFPLFPIPLFTRPVLLPFSFFFWGPAAYFVLFSRFQFFNTSSAYFAFLLPACLVLAKYLIKRKHTVWDAKPESTDVPANWVELKTSEEPVDGRGALRFERKLLKFWAQSFMLGVPKIVVGFRSRDGILRRIDELSTVDIPRQVKAAGRRTWDGNVCINFAAAFLECELFSFLFFICLQFGGERKGVQGNVGPFSPHVSLLIFAPFFVLVHRWRMGTIADEMNKCEKKNL